MCDDFPQPDPGCGECPCSCGLDRPPVDQPEGQQLAGWRLVLVSLGLFLGPVGLAILGAALAGKTAGGQLIGALAGLGVGFAISAGVARMLRRGPAAAK
jgi:hypothetical protein